jgi:hypothetical protein
MRRNIVAEQFAVNRKPMTSFSFARVAALGNALLCFQASGLALVSA